MANHDDDPDAGEAARRRDLVAMIAHELRGPLTVAMGHLELLREAGPDGFDQATRAELLDDAGEAVRRLAMMVDDITVATGADGAAGVAQPVRLEEALRMALPPDDAAGARLIAAVAGAPEVEADPEALRRILAELLAHARAVAGPEQPASLRWHATDAEVVVDVVDDGPTVPPEERDLVLRRLERPRGGLRSQRNPGLGMTVARVLAERMGGGLTVDDDGGACVVRLRLPRTGAAG